MDVLHSIGPAYIAVAVVLLIILVWWFYSADDALEEHMTGCWVAPDDFCESAEIGSMMVVLDEPVRNWRGAVESRAGYMVILPNGVRTPFTMQYQSCRSKKAHSCEIRAAVTFDDGPDWGTEPVTISIDMCRGSMEITGDREGDKPIVYARLYRQNDISDMVSGIVKTDSTTISADNTA